MDSGKSRGWKEPLEIVQFNHSAQRRVIRLCLLFIQAALRNFSMQGWFFEQDNQKDPLPLKSLAKRGYYKDAFQMDIGILFQPHLSHYILVKNKALLFLPTLTELHNPKSSLGKILNFCFKQRALAYDCIVTALGVYSASTEQWWLIVQHQHNVKHIKRSSGKED